MELIRHGEVILFPTTLPVEAKLEEESHKYVVAHSETGHHHILETTDTSKAKIYTFMGDRYIELPNEAELWHQKTGKDIHKTHKVNPGVYKIVIKREFDYFAKIIRAVRD